MKMKEYRLGDITTIYNGSTPSTRNNEYWDGDVIWITPKDLSNQNKKFIDRGERTITKEGLSKISSELLPKGTLLLSSRAPIGLLSIANTELVTNQGFKNIVTKGSILNNEYLYYYLKINIGYLNKLGTGTTFKELSKTTLENIKIKIPSILVQKSVANTLSVLDSKIELNNQINQQLEEMAKTIYDYWFVQFDFPNDKGKPYKSSGGKMVYNKKLKREIPEGWEVKELSDVVEVNNETLNPMLTPEKEFKHFSIPVFDVTETYAVEKGVDIRSNKFVVNGNDILVSKLNPWFNRVVYVENDNDLISSTEFVVWRTDDIAMKNYLYMVARNEHFIAYNVQSATGTSNSHRRVNPTLMMNYKVPFSSKIMHKFNDIIESSIKKTIELRKQNQQLASLRDWLLPMLMNGQVTVKGAEDTINNIAAEPEIKKW